MMGKTWEKIKDVFNPHGGTIELEDVQKIHDEAVTIGKSYEEKGQPIPYGGGSKTEYKEYVRSRGGSGGGGGGGGSTPTQGQELPKVFKKPPSIFQIPPTRTTSQQIQEEKEVRGIFTPITSGYLKTKEYMETHPSPQRRVADWFQEKDIDISKGMIGDIERARREKGKKSSIGFFAGSLWSGVSGSYGQMYKKGKKRTKQVILKNKNQPLISWMATTKTPQERTKEFFIKTPTPQEKTREFFISHPSPQEWAGGKLDIKTLKKTPGVSMITNIEIAHKKHAPKISSGQYFFEKLQESNPVTGDILKAYKKSGKETYRDFLTSTAETAYQEPFTDISEYIIYKDTKLFAKSKAKARGETYTYQPTSQIIGKGFGTVGKYQMYLVPGVGTALFVSPFVEKGIKGKGALRGYVKAHPIETAVSLSLIGIRMYKPTKELVSTWGKKYLPMKSLTTQEVLSETKTFPTSQQSHLKLFKESKYRLPKETQQGVWHATGYEFPSQTLTQAGKSELAGLYGASAVSPHFLRVGGEGGYGLIGTSFSLKSSAILRIYPKEIIGATAKRVKHGKFMSYQWVDDIKKGSFYVPQIKPEVEGLLPEGTKIIKTASDYYTIYKGHPIPIYQYETISKGTIRGVGGTSIKTIGEVSKSYSSGGKVGYLISPSSVTKGIIGSSTKTKSTTTSSISEIKKTSISGSSKSIIKPSYKTSISGSSKSIIKPSYKTSISGSSKSIIKPSYKTSLIKSKISTPSSKIFKPSYKSSYMPKSQVSYTPKPLKDFIPKMPMLELKPKTKGEEKTFIKQKAIKKTKYTPSLTALWLNIKSPSISKLYKAGGGGIGRRPRIVKSGSKKRVSLLEPTIQIPFTKKKKKKKKS